MIEEDTNISDSELQDFADSCYEKLKLEGDTVKVSENEYNCPYCTGNKKQFYDLKDLLQHAYGVSQGSCTKDWGGKHLGLVQYIEKELMSSDGSSEIINDTSELPGNCDNNELYVWPWIGIAANLPVQWKDGRYTGESGSKFRDQLTEEGFNPLRVHPLWNYRGHSGFAVVEFRKEWLGLTDALRFEKAYVGNHQGRRDYFATEEKRDKIYCWMACAEDYYAKNVIGDYLQKNGDLKTIAQYEEEMKRKDSRLVSSLTNTIEDQNMRIAEIETKYNENSLSLTNLMSQKDEMIRAFNAERENMQQNTRGQLERIFQEHDRITSVLETQRNQLAQREKELQKREAQNEMETLKLQGEKIQNERAILEQKRADENILKLAEDHKREKEKLQRKMMDLEKTLDAKQALELKIRLLKGNLQVVKHMGDDADGEVAGKLYSIQQELKEKEEKYEGLEALNQALIVQERKSNDELQNARKELINILKDQSSRAHIGIKRMGELDSKAFITAAKRKYPEEEIEVGATELCSLWECYVRDPHWHPFKVVPDKVGNKHKAIMDDEDEKLKELKNELGKEAYRAVTTALKEVNEYNSSGSFAISELWNYKEERRATLKEGISQLIKKWSLLKRKRR